MKKRFLIAEIGINHNGSIKIAKELIKKSKLAGFDAVKFQKRNPDICVPDNKKDQLRQTPWGAITYLKYKKKIEFEKKEFNIIDKFCKKIGIEWFASPWDIESQIFLEKYKLNYNKIPSAMLTNFALLERVAKNKKRTFISTGMSDYKNIDEAVKIFKKNKCQYILMHSVSTYPCPEEKLNLSMIYNLKKKYNCPIGYSGHEVSVSPSLMAAVMGAVAIERHVTLNRTMWGTDHAASLEFNGMKQLVDLIRKFEICYGDGIKKISHEEKKKLSDQKYW
jgi:N-acetylneuraminate synthase